MAEERKIPPIDETIQQNDEQAVQQLKQQYKQVQGLMDSQIASGRQAILNQYKIRRSDLERKYKAAADPKQKQSILDQTMSVRSQTMAKIQALMDKHAPEKQKLDATMQARMQEMAQEAKERNARLQVVRDLYASGIIPDPALVQQAEYKAAYGVTIPLNEFRQNVPSSRQKKAQLTTDIRNINARLRRFTPGKAGSWLNIIPGGKSFKDTKAIFMDPYTNEERELDPDNEKDKIIIDQMIDLKRIRDEKVNEYQNILIEENPAAKKEIEDVQRYNDAKKIAANGENLNIEESIRKTVGDQNKGKLVQMRAPDGEEGGIPQKSVAAALLAGFKRI